MMNKENIKKLILEAVNKDPVMSEIRRVSLFGSYVHGKQTAQSDVDVLIEFSPAACIGYFRLAQIQRALERSLAGKRIDLLTPEAISKYIRPIILKEAETIYEK
ncbi:nucleotidyltransferase family protein [Candidatus Margulisiibacteriota bacterium]